MEKIYNDGSYLANNPTWHEEDSPRKAKEIFQMIQKNSISPVNICEVGCGAGGVLSQLSNHLCHDKKYTGYEISEQVFELCKLKERNNITFLHRDLLKEQDAYFDLVMAIDVFEHVEDYLGFLKGLIPKSRYKIFRIPLDLSVQTVFRSSPIISARKNLGHLHYFTKETALETLKDSGYEILDFCFSAKRVTPNLTSNLRKLLYAINADLTVRVLGGYSLLVLAK